MHARLHQDGRCFVRSMDGTIYLMDKRGKVRVQSEWREDMTNLMHAGKFLQVRRRRLLQPSHLGPPLNAARETSSCLQEMLGLLQEA